MADNEIKKGDIVQIIAKDHVRFPALLIVDEVKNWGVLAVALIPVNNIGNEPIGRAYNRLPYNIILKVGKAAITFD